MTEDGTALGDEQMLPSRGVVDIGRGASCEMGFHVAVDCRFHGAGQFRSPRCQHVFIRLVGGVLVRHLMCHVEHRAWGFLLWGCLGFCWWLWCRAPSSLQFLHFL